MSPPRPPETPPPEVRISALNLVLGAIAFAFAAALLGAALRLAGVQTIVGLVAAIVTGVGFLILWNLHIHRQPYGLFLCASLLTMGGAAVTLGHGLYVADIFNDPRRVPRSPQVDVGSASKGAVSRAPVFAPENDRPVRATAQATPSATPARSTVWLSEWRTAQAEAVRRYPALAIPNSSENRSFVDAYQGMNRSNPKYFDDPEWPLILAQALAERDGWTRGDGIVEESPLDAEPTAVATPLSMDEPPPEPAAGSLVAEPVGSGVPPPPPAPPAPPGMDFAPPKGARYLDPPRSSSAPESDAPGSGFSVR